MPGQEVTHGRPQGVGTVDIEDARIFYKNFAGREGTYNEAGDRNFGCALPAEIALPMKEDGWNVKEMKQRDGDDGPAQYWVPVAVSFKFRPPRIVVITRRFNFELQDFERVRTTLPEDLVEMIDYADIESLDLTLNPYPYNVNGRSGIKAYLRSMYVTIAMDRFEEKYAAVKEIDLGDGTVMLELDNKPFEEEFIEGEIISDSYDD